MISELIQCPQCKDNFSPQLKLETLDCGHYMCSMCVMSIHKQLFPKCPQCKNNSHTDLKNDVYSNKMTPEMGYAPKQNLCSIHNQLFDLMCTDCNIPICLQCSMEEFHQGHKFDILSTYNKESFIRQEEEEKVKQECFARSSPSSLQNQVSFMMPDKTNLNFEQKFIQERAYFYNSVDFFYFEGGQNCQVGNKYPEVLVQCKNSVHLWDFKIYREQIIYSSKDYKPILTTSFSPDENQVYIVLNNTVQVITLNSQRSIESIQIKSVNIKANKAFFSSCKQYLAFQGPENYIEIIDLKQGQQTIGVNDGYHMLQGDKFQLPEDMNSVQILSIEVSKRAQGVLLKLAHPNQNQFIYGFLQLYLSQKWVSSQFNEYQAAVLKNQGPQNLGNSNLNQLNSISFENGLKCYEQSQIYFINHDNLKVENLYISPYDSLLIGTYKGAFYLYDLANKANIEIDSMHNDEILAVSIQEEQRYIASLDSSGLLCLYEKEAK